ncbi:unnamed protein product [Malus baccata var. baccata]
MLHFVILGIDPSVKVNDLYLHLADNLMMFNKYPRESLSFELIRGALLFAPESTNNDGGLLLMVVVITVLDPTCVQLSPKLSPYFLCVCRSLVILLVVHNETHDR